MKYRKTSWLIHAAFVAARISLAAEPKEGLPTPEALVLNVRADQPGPQINKTQYGVFFEELSHAGEGGLYAELVKNRSFEDSITSIPDWECYAIGNAKGAMSLETADLLNSAQSRALKVDLRAPGTVGVANTGYWGINVVKGRTYDLSFFAKSSLPPNATITAKLQNRDGTRTYATWADGTLAGAWKKHIGTMTADDTEPRGRLALEVTSERPGSLWLDVVSLFPPTWKGRANGARPDLAEMVARMKPGVIRFPGGSYVSTKPAEAPKPLNELGPIERRPGHPSPGKTNPWGYHNTDGFGLHEYLQFAEDLGAKPIYVFQGGADPVAEPGQPGTFITGAALDQLVQETLSVIEYANDPVTTIWGGQRAANGHPEPFNMKFVQIGNENWHKPFHENYVKIYAAIRQRYPDLQVIWGGDWIGNNQHGYKSDGIMPEGSAAEIVDEHYYKEDNWFYKNSDRFSPDHYPRQAGRAAKIFIGEASAVKDTLEGALKETAFLLGAEKYSDKVVMAVYAPLFANVNFKKWPANAIYFDSARAYGTPSYHAQAMLGNNTGDVNIAVVGFDALINRTLFINANLIQASGEVILKIVNSEAVSRHLQIVLDGMKKAPASGREVVLTGPDLVAGNSFENPFHVAPVETKLDQVGKSFPYVVAPYSFTVLRLAPQP